MESDIYYVNFENKDIECTTPPKTPSRHQHAGKAQKCRGSGCLVLMAMAMCFVSLICVLLLVVIILQHLSITADRNLFKNNKDTVQVFNQTISKLQYTYSDLMTKNDKLQDRFNGMSDELKKVYKKGWFLGWLFITNISKSWSDSRQYCKDQGADLVIINNEEKQRFITSNIKSDVKVWIGLSDIYREGKMKWVDNSPLKQGFWQEDEPNNRNGNEDCVGLDSSVPGLNNWNDASCLYTRKAICEK